MREPSPRAAEVLLVDDNEVDVFLTRQSLENSKLHLNLSWVKDGVDCMAFLRKQDPFAAAPTPDLILLDLNMPRMDGRQVIAQLIEDEFLSQIPVVVLTSSALEQDILQASQLKCSAYIIKPVDFAKLVQLVKALRDYCFTLSLYPVLPLTRYIA